MRVFKIKFQLLRMVIAGNLRNFSEHSVRVFVSERENCSASFFGRAVREIKDFALIFACNPGMRLFHEGTEIFRAPVVTARCPRACVHSLLDYNPVALVAEDKIVHIKLKSVLNCSSIDFSRELACIYKREPIETCRIRKIQKLVGRFPGVFSAPAANIKPQFFCPRVKTAF